MTPDGGLPAVPAGRGLVRGGASGGKLASMAKAGALLAAVGLAGAGASTLSGSPEPAPISPHVTSVTPDPGWPPDIGPSGRPAGSGAGRVAVPEPPSILLAIVSVAGVLAARSLLRRKAG